MAKKGKRNGGGSYRGPGVYVEEVTSGSKPIEGVGTAIAGFVRLAPASLVRRAGTLLVLVTGAAVAAWAWRQRTAGALDSR